MEPIHAPTECIRNGLVQAVTEIVRQPAGLHRRVPEVRVRPLPPLVAGGAVSDFGPGVRAPVKPRGRARCAVLRLRALVAGRVLGPVI